MWNSCCQLFNRYMCERCEGSSSFFPFLPPIPPCCFFLGCENVIFFCSSRNAASHYPFFTFLCYQEAFVAEVIGRLLCTSPCFMVIWRQLLAVSVVTLWSLGSQLAAILEFSSSIGSSVNKESACNAGNPASIPGLGRSLGEGHGKPLQYPCLENLVDWGAWWATVCRVPKSQTAVKQLSTHVHIAGLRAESPLCFSCLVFWCHSCRQS